MTTSIPTLDIDLRPAKAGNQINANGQKHGEDTVTAFYIPVHSLMLSKNEANILAGDPTWWSRHFNELPGKPAEVLDADNFDTKCSFKHKLEKARVRIVHSLANEEIEFTACKLSKIKLQPQTGGLTAASMMIETVPTLDARAAALLGQLDHEINIEIRSAELSAEARQTDMLGAHPDPDATNTTPVDKTRVLEPGQAEREADAQRQLTEALRGLETPAEQAEQQSAA